MAMTLSPDDVKAIADAVHQERLDGNFHIDPQKHYDQHARLDRMLTVFEACENKVWRFIFGFALFVAFVVAVIWAAVTKGQP